MLTSVGWISDRFTLANYRLDASFFQTIAGTKAAGSGISSAGPQSLAFPINSWASILIICATLFLVAAFFVWQLKRTEGVTISNTRKKGLLHG